jgi:hypothetical protein
MYEKTTMSWDVLKAYILTKPQKEYKAISPSSLGGCMRSHYWKVKGVPATTPPNVGALVNFEVGHHWEAVLAAAYANQNMLVKWFQDGKDDPFFDPETGLGGTPDLLIEKEGELYVVDSKTVNSLYFKYAEKKSFNEWVKDNMDYVYQQVAYVHLCRLAGYNVQKAILSFASKDNGYISLEFQITVTQELLTMVKDRAKKLKGYLDRNELPPCECAGWKVGYCNYGNPATTQPNSKKKIVNTECCGEGYVTSVGELTNADNLERKDVNQGLALG